LSFGFSQNSKYFRSTKISKSEEIKDGSI